MANRVPLEVRIGLALTLLGIVCYSAIHHWTATRTFVAVDIPVSLDRGHIRTGPFNVNVSNYFQVVLDTGENQPFNPTCVQYNLFKVRWELYKEGQVVARLDDQFANTVCRWIR